MEDTTIRGYARKGQAPPCVSIDFCINNTGYQMDVYLDGKIVQIACRDFGGAPKHRKAVEKLLHRIENAVDEWRQSL